MTSPPPDLGAARQRAARTIADSYATPLPIALRAFGSIPLTIGVFFVLAALLVPDERGTSLVTVGIMLLVGALLIAAGLWLVSATFRHSGRQLRAIRSAVTDVRAAQRAGGTAEGPGVLRQTLQLLGWPFAVYAAGSLAAAAYFLSRLLG